MATSGTEIARDKSLNPKVVSRAEWLVASRELLAKEKEFKRKRDALAAQREPQARGPGAFGVPELPHGQAAAHRVPHVWLVQGPTSSAGRLTRSKREGRSVRVEA